MEYFQYEVTQKINENLLRHIEEYAAAFVKYCKLPPNEIVMKVKYEWQEGQWIQHIWFEKKENK